MSSQKAREAFELHREPEAVREKYGMNRFGQSCLLARRLIEAGVRFVTVNMFETVFDEITWDIHGSKPFSPISCYRDLVGPMFDMAYSSLLEDLPSAACLSNTMVVATGEFGRTPKINPAGGRDHWPQCWTMLMGGGPLKGGTVVGASDEIGGAPKDRPVYAGEGRRDRLPAASASTCRSNCPARRAGRFRWWTAASSPSGSCSHEAARCLLLAAPLFAADSLRVLPPSVELTGPEAASNSRRGFRRRPPGRLDACRGSGLRPIRKSPRSTSTDLLRPVAMARPASPRARTGSPHRSRCASRMRTRHSPGAFAITSSR